jgi:hypothetical protein
MPVTGAAAFCANPSPKPATPRLTVKSAQNFVPIFQALINGQLVIEIYKKMFKIPQAGI